MEEKEVYITADGLEKLKNELNIIENTKLKEIAQKIAEAKDLGDLSENAEYHEAKQKQAFLNGKALELRYKIKHAKIITNGRTNGKVSAGSTVKVSFGDQKVEFTLVGSDESDPANGKISISSPIGRALIGRKVGNSVSVETPAGKTEYKIVSIG